MRLGKWKEAFAYLENLRSLPTVFEHHMNEDLSMRLFTLGKSTELTLYAQSGEFEKGLELLPEIVAGLKRYDENISSVRKAHFYFNSSVILFGMEHYHESLKWINKLLNNVDIDKTKDIHCIGQILNLVIHLELGNTELLPYTLRSTQRFLETRNKVFRFENVMLEFINEMLKKRQSKSIDELYVDLLDQLQELRSDEHEKIVFEYFDFLAWVKSKTNGKKYRELVAA
jgi:tetratricopeptide (TPR) repeat protein